MNGKPHYFAIGLFVLAANLLLVIGLIVFSADALRNPIHFIETYVDESVQGIEVGTPFKFRGVKIGNIHEIRLVSEEYDTEKMYILIRVALDDSIMRADTADMLARTELQVQRGLRVKLVPQGITGLSFLDADYYPENLTAPLEIDWEPRYTYIPSTPAMMTVISRTIENLTTQINSLNLTAIGNNVELISSNANVTVEDLKKLIDDMQGVVDDSDSDIDLILTNLRYITEEIHEIVRMVKKSPSTLLTEPPKRSLSQ